MLKAWCDRWRGSSWSLNSRRNSSAPGEGGCGRVSRSTPESPPYGRSSEWRPLHDSGPAPRCPRQRTGMRFAFAIPLKARSACSNWDAAQQNLRRTVRSAQAAAAADDGLIVVACHDEPELGSSADNVRVLPVPFPEPTNMQDAGRDKA